jgi:GT2 family glycosyltransferase
MPQPKPRFMFTAAEGTFAEQPHRSDTAKVLPVTVVIPTFNRAADVARALESLSAQSAGAVHVVVVDNSSTDNTGDLVRAQIASWNGRLRYVHKDPVGPASARNAGLALAHTPFVLFMDSDVELPGEWVGRALAHMERDPKLAAVGGLILYAFEPTRINAFGGDLGRMGLAWDMDEGVPLNGSARAADRIWINCSAMLVRAGAVSEAGGFDETYFYGYEDSDLGWRLNLMGYRVSVYPDLCAHHHVSQDSGTAHSTLVFHYCKNRLRMILKNASPRRLPFMLAGYAAYSLADLVLRGQRAAKLRAVGWNMGRLGETLALRRAVQEKRTVSDADVFRRGSRRWFPPTALNGRRRRRVELDKSGHKTGPA